MGNSPITRKENLVDCDLAISRYLVTTIWNTDSVDGT